MSDVRDWDRPFKHLSDEEVRRRVQAIAAEGRARRAARAAALAEPPVVSVDGAVQYEYTPRPTSVARETGSDGTQLDRIERRLDSMEVRLHSIEGRLDSVERRLGAVESGLEHVDRAVNGLRVEVEAARDDINVLAENLGRLEQKVDVIAAHHDAHARTLQSHDLRLTRLESERAG